MNTLEIFSTKKKDKNYIDKFNWIFDILTTYTYTDRLATLRVFQAASFRTGIVLDFVAV
jgi:uncharacterized membrane protein